MISRFVTFLSEVKISTFLHFYQVSLLILSVLFCWMTFRFFI
eukprot:UN10591